MRCHLTEKCAVTAPLPRLTVHAPYLVLAQGHGLVKDSQTRRFYCLVVLLPCVILHCMDQVILLIISIRCVTLGSWTYTNQLIILTLCQVCLVRALQKRDAQNRENILHRQLLICSPSLAKHPMDNYHHLHGTVFIKG